MKQLVAVMTLLLLQLPAIASAQFDQFDQFDLNSETLQIPPTHQTEQYEWQAIRNPGAWTLDIAPVQSSDAGKFSMSIKTPPGVETEEIQVFITDEEMEVFRRVQPEKLSKGNYQFSFLPPKAGEYRFETAIKTGNGWIDLRKDLELEKTVDEEPLISKDGGQGCGVNVKREPERIYADHVVTFIYEPCCHGEALDESMKLDDSQLRVAAWSKGWFRRWNEFVYATPKQKLDGSVAAVSLVFKQPGNHVVFTEIKQGGEVKYLREEVRVYKEPDADLH